MSFYKSIMLISCIAMMALAARQVQGAENKTRLREVLSSMDECILQSVYSFINDKSLPPTSIGELKKQCVYQAEGFKCTKDRAKLAPGLVKRGVTSLIQSRQRFNKKLCTNPENEQTQKFLVDMKCVLTKNLGNMRKVDIEFLNKVNEIDRRNLKDSSTELRALCCTIYEFRRKLVAAAIRVCPQTKTTMDELVHNMISDDVNLVCEDEDKLISKCEKMEQIKVSDQLQTGLGSAPSKILYMLVTLGEDDST